MLHALVAGNRVTATPQQHGLCPQCRTPVVAKCGRLVRWHWAHQAADCDPWSQESEWHLAWKSEAAQTEIVITRNGATHRADIVTPDDVVVELQNGYLSTEMIAAREAFYGRMVWLYNTKRFYNNLHFGAHGFWWKHGSKSMTTSTKPIFWDVGDQVWRVSLSLVDVYNDAGYVQCQRVLGRIEASRSRAEFLDWIRGARPSKRIHRPAPWPQRPSWRCSHCSVVANRPGSCGFCGSEVITRDEWLRLYQQRTPDLEEQR
jgi:competence protein CoiA